MPCLSLTPFGAVWRSGIAKPDPRIPHSTQRTHLASSGHARDSTRGVTLHDLLFNVAPFPSRASIREVPSCRIAHRPDRTRHDRGLPRDTSPRWASIIWRLPLLSSRCFTRPQGPRAHSLHDGDGRTGARPAPLPQDTDKEDQAASTESGAPAIHRFTARTRAVAPSGVIFSVCITSPRNRGASCTSCRWKYGFLSAYSE